jgi:hypothetical protein
VANTGIIGWSSIVGVTAFLPLLDTERAGVPRDKQHRLGDLAHFVTVFNTFAMGWLPNHPIATCKFAAARCARTLAQSIST